MGQQDAETHLKRGRPVSRPDPEADPCLQILTGEKSGTLIRIAQGSSIIGRGSTAAVQLDDNGVSRDHAKIIVSEEGIANLVDLSSTNGTYLNGAPVDVAVLRDGDRIHVGPDAALLFVYLPPGATAKAVADRPQVPEKDEEPHPLSARELEVSQLVAEGLTNPEIGKRLFISPRTVTTHLVKVYERLGIHSRTALTRWIMERGLLRKEK